MRAPLAVALLLFAASMPASCSKPVDLTQAVQVQDVSTGWFDAGLVDGQNKLVPTATFKIKNVSSERLNVLQINVLFKRVIEDTEWGDAFVTVAGSEGLAPGATSDAIAVKSQLGYTGTEPRLQMLQNSRFVDAKVQLFAKYSSTNWIRIAEYPVARTLLSK